MRVRELFVDKQHRFVEKESPQKFVVIFLHFSSTIMLFLLLLYHYTQLVHGNVTFL